MFLLLYMGADMSLRWEQITSPCLGTCKKSVLKKHPVRTQYAPVAEFERGRADSGPLWATD